MLAGFLYFSPLARLSGQTPPTRFGYLMAALGVPAILAADATFKRYRRTRAGAAH
jgi:hypothetical protein